MNSPRSVSHLVDICRLEYIRLARHLYRRGLDTNTIQKTWQSLVENRPDGCFLKCEAYHPTGLALGCPLPNVQATEAFTRVTRLMEGWLARAVCPTHPAFSCVPARDYHITVLNRTHYEFSPEYYPLSENERQAIEKIIIQLGFGQITILTSGLLLTHSGRLFVKCLPMDDHILHLRDVLTNAFPQLRVHVPRMIHIKLGHLNVSLSPNETKEFLAWLQRLENHVIYSMVFTDIYTPAGRISL